MQDVESPAHPCCRPAAKEPHPGRPGEYAQRLVFGRHVSGYWLGGLLLVVAATSMWSTSGTFIALVKRSTGISAQGLAFWRDLTTFLCLFIGARLIQPAWLRVDRRDLPRLAAMGAVGIGGFHILWNLSVELNGVPVATVLQYNAPVFVAIVSWLLWREQFRWPKLVAIGLALAGTVIISDPSSLGAAPITPLGLLVGLGTSIAFGAFALIAKQLVGSYSRWTVLLYVFGFGMLATVPFQFSAPLVPVWPLPWVGVGAFVGLILLTTIVGFGLYAAGLRRLPASVATLVATMEVPFAAVVAYFVLNEKLNTWQMLGAALIVAGVILVSCADSQ